MQRDLSEQRGLSEQREALSAAGAGAAAPPAPPQQQLTPEPPQEALSGAQLSALQARLEALHAADLFSEAEFYQLEDLCGDVAEVRAAVGTVSSKEVMAFQPAAKVVSSQAML